MERGVIGLYLDRESAELAAYNAGARGPIAQYRKILWYKARVRSREYMQALFQVRYPTGQFKCVDEGPDWMPLVADADVVVLLYPDSIGLGFGDVERSLPARVKPWTVVRVLNGRRREFVLDRGTLGSLRMRRVIERTMLGEAVFGLVFAVVTPVLLLRDLLGFGNED